MRNFKVALAAACAVVVGWAFTASAAYVPVEWIKADGKQWIYTGYQPTCTDRIEMKVKFSTVGASQCLYCSRGTTTTKDTFTGFLIKDTKKIRFDRNTSTSVSSSMTVGTVDDYVLVADGNSLSCKVNGQPAATMAGDTFTPGSAFSLFASHTQGTALSDTTASSSMDNWGSYTLYYFRIYDKDGKLVRQFIPARDDSVSSGTAQYGLYELVTQTFHPGLGSGSFTAGSDAGSYRWNADKQCVEYQVSARGTDGVTVSLNGETYSESVVTDWTELGTSVSVTVTAQAPQGCSVIWEGVPAGVAAVRSGNSITLTLSEAATLRATAHTCTALYWRGTTDALASKAANWADAGGTVAASAPLNGDAIVLDADAANKPMTWDLDEVEPASWTQTADYTGTVTFQTGVVIDGKTVHGSAAVDADGTAVRELVIDGTVSLEGGKWTVTAQPTDSAFSQLDQVKRGLGLYRLQVRATGDFTIGADAKVSAGLCGFYKMGPGAVTNSGNTGGGSHGGVGGGGVAPYGSATDPRTQGSGCCGGGGSRAGGVVRLTVGGLLTVNGSVDADSEPRANAYTAAGGSVCIVAGEIAGTGRISADGEHRTGGSYSPAGGGRVAVKVTRKNATASAFEGEIHAYGGGTQADATKSVTAVTSISCGTVYLEDADDGEKGGTLILRSYKMTPNRNCYAGLCDEDGECNFKKIVFEGGARLRVWPNVALSLNEVEPDATYRPAIQLRGTTVLLPRDFAPTGYSLYAIADGTKFLFKDGDGEKTLTIGNGQSLYVSRSTTLDGSLHILSGGQLAQESNSDLSLSNPETMCYLNLALTGDLTIDAGGVVTAKACGYAANTGPGRPNTDKKAASHGGITSSGQEYGTTYGSITRPYTHGSGGYSVGGGGVIKLAVAGKLTVNGRIDADASNFSGGGYAAGSGGSIWITAGSIEGSANIRARGGLAGSPSAGGGRIAVTLTNAGADFTDFTGRIIAWGAAAANSPANDDLSKPVGGCGTVYLRHGGEGETEGTLVIDNGTSATTSVGALISTDVTETEVGNVHIKGNARLTIGADAKLTVHGNWTNEGMFDADPATTETAAGKVEFVDADKTSVISGSTTFADFVVKTPGKRISFACGDNDLVEIAPGGKFVVAGEEGRLVKLQSSEPGVQWKLAVQTGASADVTFADVSDSDASAGGGVTAYDSLGKNANNVKWNFLERVKPGALITWTGEGGTAAWGATDNWDPVREPIDTDVIVIPAGCAVYPELPGALTVNKLTVEAGATLAFRGYALTVTNGLNVAGAMATSGGELLSVGGDLAIAGVTGPGPSVTFFGPAAQAVAVGGRTFDAVTVAKTGGSVAFAGGFTAAKFTYPAQAACVLTFAAGETYTVTDLAIDGAVGGEAGLALASMTTGERWKLNVVRRAQIAGVSVSYSAATGIPLYVDLPCVNGGNNDRWNFGFASAKWAGGASGGFFEPANWSTESVPGANTRVILESDATIDLAGEEAAHIRELWITGGRVNLKGANALVVDQALAVDSGATAVLDAPVTVGSALVAAEAKITHTGPHARGVTNRVCLTVLGDMEIAAKGSIDVTGKGWSRGVGPGTPTTDIRSASHGGSGNDNKPCYGSVFEPVAPGSGGLGRTESDGGGVVRLIVGGALVHNGEIVSSGTIPGFGAGAGGSIWITAGTLSGTGTISARGGNFSQSAYGGAGGGGRVAIYLTEATSFAGYNVDAINAYGGRLQSSMAGEKPASACGTVYLQTAADMDGCGQVVLDNDGSTSVSRGAELPARNGDEAAAAFGRARLVLRNGGVLLLQGDAKVADLLVEKGSAKFLLNDHVLGVASRDHRNGVGWRGETNKKLAKAYVESVCDKGAEGRGEIFWSTPGMMLLVR